MVDAFSGSEKNSEGGLREYGQNAADLLAAVVRFSGADKGLLLRPDEDSFVVETWVDADDSETPLDTRPSVVLAPYQVRLVNQVASLGKTVFHGASNVSLTATGASACLCVPMGQPGNVSHILYLETADSSRGFPQSIIQAVELYALAFGKALCVQKSGEPTASPGQADIFTGIDPIILSGIAESIALEINDSLSAVVAHAGAGLQWLNHQSPKLEKARQSFRKIAASTFSVGNIVSTYRSTSKSGGPALELVDVGSIVAGALEAASAELVAADVRSECDLSDGAMIFAEAKQIEQAIVTLVSVALDAMKDVPEPRRLSISSTVQDRHLVVAFSDSGPLIPIEARDAIFDPSYSTKQGSRGIKLAIARTIAQLHGGSLDIARSDADGTTMLLRLPAKSADEVYTRDCRS